MFGIVCGMRRRCWQTNQIANIAQDRWWVDDRRKRRHRESNFVASFVRCVCVRGAHYPTLTLTYSSKMSTKICWKTSFEFVSYRIDIDTTVTRTAELQLLRWWQRRNEHVSCSAILIAKSLATLPTNLIYVPEIDRATTIWMRSPIWAHFYGTMLNLQRFLTNSDEKNNCSKLNFHFIVSSLGDFVLNCVMFSFAGDQMLPNSFNRWQFVVCIKFSHYIFIRRFLLFCLMYSLSLSFSLHLTISLLFRSFSVVF